MSRIQIYILKQCLSGLAIVVGLLVLAILLIDVVEQLRTVGGDVSLSLLSALRLSLMKLPMIVEQTLPFALLAATMMAFTRLNRRSELSIIRASGLSAWRFLTPVIVLGVVLGLFSSLALNPFAARLTQSFEAERARRHLEDAERAPVDRDRRHRVAKHEKPPSHAADLEVTVGVALDRRRVPGRVADRPDEHAIGAPLGSD